MWSRVALLLVVLFTVVKSDPTRRVQLELPKEDPDTHRTATELITSKGYPCENHWITTEDGYILNALRIPYGRHDKYAGKGKKKPVVFLQHGLFGGATNFITNDPYESLGFILADAGVDVWIGNSRGNGYSKNHTTLNPKHLPFWFFSWDQMAKYDLPACINYIRKASGQDDIYYVGHSQGTTIGFAEFSEDQEVASHIKHFFALAPVSSVWHNTSPLKLLAPLARTLNGFFNIFGHGEIVVPPEIIKLLSDDVCPDEPAMCEDGIFLLAGADSESMNKSRLGVYVGHTPTSTSSRDVLQWAQQINSRRFQKYDYGSPLANYKHYGQIRPPRYDPSKMKIPVSLFTGGKDILSVAADVAWLEPQINVYQHIDIPHYAHLDFIWAVDAEKLIYSHILKVIRDTETME